MFYLKGYYHNQENHPDSLLLVFKEFHIASLIYFELIFVTSTILMSRFSFSLYGDVQFNCSSTISLKNYLFSISLLFTIYQKSVDCICEVGFYFWAFYSVHCSICLFSINSTLFWLLYLWDYNPEVRWCQTSLLLPFNIILAGLPWWLNH